MSLGKVIRKKRELMNLTLDQVSKLAGFSKPYLSTIENDKVKNPPSDALLLKLESILEFEKGLLLHIAHMQSIPSDIKTGYESAQAENKKWRSLAQKLMDTSSNESLSDFLSQDQIDPEKGFSSLASGSLVPIINKVAAGYPADFNDLDYPVGIADDYIRCPDLHDPNAFAVRVVGDSMEPKFNEGDIVVFSPASQVNNGDDCFIRFTLPHETTFKRIFFDQHNTIRLQPRNEKYSPLMIPAERINGIYRAVIKYEKL